MTMWISKVDLHHNELVTLGIFFSEQEALDFAHSVHPELNSNDLHAVAYKIGE